MGVIVLKSLVQKVILDILGGDNSPNVPLAAAADALKRDPELQLVCVGDETVIKHHLSKYMSRVEIIHTTTNIGFNEHPTEAIRTKKDSSIVLGLNALRDRADCGGFVSAGSTGAILTGGFMIIGRINGVSRPALSTFLPAMNGRKVLVLDLGANMDCKPQNIVHFAVMADQYLRSLGVENPRIGLLNVGAEEEKGNELTLAAFAQLKKAPINFIGNVEAVNAFDGHVDAVVADGFAGNVLLKTVEGSGALFSHELKRAIGRPHLILGKLIVGPRLLKMKRDLSADGTGGAIFLGLKKTVIKIHGSTSAIAMRNAIFQARDAGVAHLTDNIAVAVAKA